MQTMSTQKKTIKTLFPILILLCACGAPAPQTETAESQTLAENPDGSQQKSQKTETAPATPAPIVDITRTELDDVIKKGPANILAMVQTDSIMRNGKFVGFRIVSFRTEALTILGIQPEDIVRRINGLPIERPEQFLKVFEQLKTAKELTFTVVRDSKELTLKTPIQ